jgi:hypothetical protein
MSSSDDPAVPIELRDRTGRVVATLETDGNANGQRLKITSALTGDVQYVDALMLEALTWLTGEGLEP